MMIQNDQGRSTLASKCRYRKPSSSQMVGPPSSTTTTVASEVAMTPKSNIGVIDSATALLPSGQQHTTVGHSSSSTPTKLSSIARNGSVIAGRRTKCDSTAEFLTAYPLKLFVLIKVAIEESNLRRILSQLCLSAQRFPRLAQPISPHNVRSSKRVPGVMNRIRCRLR